MLAIELPITNFSLLDSSQDASDIDYSPVIRGTIGLSSHYSRPCARNRAAAIRQVYRRCTTHQGVRVSCRLPPVEGACEPLSRGQRDEAVRISEIPSLRWSTTTYPNGLDPARPQVSRARS